MIGLQDMSNDSSNFIAQILNDYRCDEDILIFWGQDFLKSIGISNVSLKNALSAKILNCYYSAGVKKAFVHPGIKNKSKQSRLKSFDKLIVGKTYW